MSITYDLDDYKLETTFQRNPECILHASYKSDRARGIRKVLIIDRWVPQKPLLGGGTFGTVRLEQCADGHGTKGTYRAVKLLHKMHLSRSKIDFKKELMALAKFSRSKFSRSQVFVEFLGWFEDDDYVYLAMEYFPLGTLDKFISDEVKERDAKLISSQLLEGLTIMHEEGFAHRDLKPQNIFVVQNQPNWWVKIGDFGITKRVSNNDTALQTYTGTPYYLAPEVARYVDTGDEESDGYTHAVDIWSFACVVYQIMALQVPFPNHESIKDFCKKGPFPEAPLVGRTSAKGIGFIKSILVTVPTLRPRAQDLIQSEWLQIEDSPPEIFPDTGVQISSDVSDATTVGDLTTGFSVVALQDAEIIKTGSFEQNSLYAPKTHPKSSSQASPQIANNPLWPQHQPLSNQSSRFPDNSNGFQHYPSIHENPNDIKSGTSSSNQDIKRRVIKDPSKEHGLSDISLVASSSRNSTDLFRNRAVGETHPRNDSRHSLYGDDQGKIFNAPSTPSYYSDAEGSASWSTHSRSVLHISHRSTDMPAKRTAFEHSASLSPQDQSWALKQYGRETVFSPRSATAESISEVKTQVYVKVPTALQGHSNSVSAVAFSLDGKLIASASGDKTIRLWDSATWAAQATLKGHSDWIKAVAFSPDGKLIASASCDKTIRLWDSATWAARATLKGHSSRVSAMAFSPDSELIASASGDKTVRLWASATTTARPNDNLVIKYFKKAFK